MSPDVLLRTRPVGPPSPTGAPEKRSTVHLLGLGPRGVSARLLASRSRGQEAALKDGPFPRIGCQRNGQGVGAL